jgi:glycosyltransferase involved in cell wall biosynthesis
MRIKIFFILPTLDGGGAEKNTINIVNSLDPNKFDTRLIVCGGQNTYIKLLRDDIAVENLNKRRVLAALWKLSLIFLKEKPKIVFTTSEHVSFLVTVIKTVIFQRYINVVRFPTLPSNKLGVHLKAKLLLFFNTYVSRKADFIIAQSDIMNREIKNILKVPTHKVITIPNLVNKEQIRLLSQASASIYNEKDFNLVAVGSLYSVKGFDILIQSILVVQKIIPNVKLHILGKESVEKGYEAYLDKIISQNGLENTVVFHGLQLNPYPYMKQANLYILSSIKEGFPNVVLESLTVGTPVVATDCVDFSHIIIEGKNGCIVPKNNIKALAEGIIRARHLEKMDFDYANFDYGEWFNVILTNNL